MNPTCSTWDCAIPAVASLETDLGDGSLPYCHGCLQREQNHALRVGWGYTVHPFPSVLAHIT